MTMMIMMMVVVLVDAVVVTAVVLMRIEEEEEMDDSDDDDDVRLPPLLESVTVHEKKRRRRASAAAAVAFVLGHLSLAFVARSLRHPRRSPMATVDAVVVRPVIPTKLLQFLGGCCRFVVRTSLTREFDKNFPAVKLPSDVYSSTAYMFSEYRSCRYQR